MADAEQKVITTATKVKQFFVSYPMGGGIAIGAVLHFMAVHLLHWP